MDKWTHRQTGKWTNGHMDKQTNGQTDKEKDKQRRGGWMNEWTNR